MSLVDAVAIPSLVAWGSHAINIFALIVASSQDYARFKTPRKLISSAILVSIFTFMLYFLSWIEVLFVVPGEGITRDIGLGIVTNTARYGMYSICTYLLIDSVAYLLLMDEDNRQIVVVSTLATLVFGELANNIPSFILLIVFGALSFIAYIVLMYFVVFAAANDNSTRDLTKQETMTTFNWVRYLVLAAWIIYPVAWLIGPRVFAAVPLFVEGWINTGGDFITKIGFYWVCLILCRQKLDDKGCLPKKMYDSVQCPPNPEAGKRKQPIPRTTVPQQTIPRTTVTQQTQRRTIAGVPNPQNVNQNPYY